MQKEKLNNEMRLYIELIEENIKELKALNIDTQDYQLLLMLKGAYKQINYIKNQFKEA
jgi:hypothetical protein